MGGNENEPPVYSALSSTNFYRPNQRENNEDEAAENATWDDRIRAGYTGVAHGLVSHGPEQLYRALKTVGKIINSDSLRDYADEGIQRELQAREADPYYQVPENWMKDEWSRSLYEGTRGIASSAYAMLPGAAVSLIPGAQAIGVGMMGAGAGSIAGLSSYDSYMDEAVEKFQALNPKLTREDIENEQFQSALWYSLAEGGTEAVTDIMGAKLIGLFGKAGVKPAKHILDQLVRNLTKTVSLEAGSEVTTAMVQDYIKEQAGLDYIGRVKAMKQTVGPALVGGVAFGVGGTALKAAQGKLGVDSQRVKTEAEHRADIDAQTQELRRQYRESHYTPQAVSMFDSLMNNGGDYVQASSMMEATESVAKSWAIRSGQKALDWRGDTAALADMFKRMNEHKADPTVTPQESLSSFTNILFSELSGDQKRGLADVYGMPESLDVDGAASVIDIAKFEADLSQTLTDSKYLESLPESIRPVMESMRDGLLDLHTIVKRGGLVGAVDSDVSTAITKAIEFRDANKPKPAAFIYEDTDLEGIRKQYGDFTKLDAEKQSAMIKDMAHAMEFNFDTWDLPTDQKGMLAFVDTEMKPLLNKILHRGKRGDAKHEGLAKDALQADGIDLDRFAEFTAQLTGNGDIKQSAAVKARELMLTERLLLEKATQLATIANESLAPPDIMKWQMVGIMHQQAHTMLRAVRSESGHLLRAWNFIKKDPELSSQRLQQLYDATGGFKTAQAKLTAFANARTDADRAGVLADSVKAKSLRMFHEFRVMNMLSSLKTHIVNATGNSGTLVNEIWNRHLASKMGKGQAIPDGEAMAMIDGIWDGLLKVRDQWVDHKNDKGGTVAALRSTKEMWDTDPTTSLIADAGMYDRQLTKENTLDVIGAVKERVGLSKDPGMVSNGLATMIDYLGRTLSISSDLLYSSDMFFKTLAAHAEVNALNHRRATQEAGGDNAKYTELKKRYDQNVPAEHRQAAQEFGKFVTFQNDLHGFANTLNQVRMKHPSTQELVPFFKTPVNIMMYAARHTPGLSSLFKDIRTELNSPDIATRHLAEARVMTGTLLWTTAISMAAAGYLTGSGPIDDNERNKAYATGWQANSLRIPGGEGKPATYIAINRLDPIPALIFDSAASLMEIYDSLDDDDLGKAMSAGWAAAYKVASDQTYLRSIFDSIDAIRDWKTFAGTRARRNMAGTLVPGSAMLRQISQQVDPVYREINGVMDHIRTGIPGASLGMPPRRNFLGEEIRGDGFYGPDFLSPLRQSFDKQDPVYDEIYRLAKGGHKVPGMPQRSMRHDKKGIKMDGETYSRFVEMAGVGLKVKGKTAKEKIADLIVSDKYAGWDDAKKATQIKSIMDGYRKKARDKMKKEDAGLRRLLGIE